MGPKHICDGSPTNPNLHECKSNWSSFNHSTCEYGSHRLTGVLCVRRWCSHKIIFIANNRRLACTWPVVNAWDRFWFGDKCSHKFYSTNPTHAQSFLLSFFDGGDGAEAATTRASRRSKRVTRGQPATPEKIESDTSHKIWRHPDRYFPYSLV